MKRIIGMIFALMLIVTIFSCNSIEKNLLGEWKIEVVIMGIAAPEEPQYVEIVFEKDGRGYGRRPLESPVDFMYVIDGEEMTFSYIGSDGIEVEKTVPFVLNDTTLTFISERADVVFNKV